MVNTSDNCIVCGEEFNCDELKSISLSAVNVTKFKICVSCLDESNPVDDYRQVRDIVTAYMNFSNKKQS